MFLPAMFFTWFKHAFSICFRVLVGSTEYIRSTESEETRRMRTQHRIIVRFSAALAWSLPGFGMYMRAPHCFLCNVASAQPATMFLPQTMMTRHLRPYDSTTVQRYKGWPGATSRQLKAFHYFVNAETAFSLRMSKSKVPYEDTS